MTDPEPWYMGRAADVALAPFRWYLAALYRLVDKVDAHIGRRLDQKSR